MNASELATLKRAIQTLGFQSKLHLTRQDVSKLIEELTLSRDYEVADQVQSMDPAMLNQYLR